MKTELKLVRITEQTLDRLKVLSKKKDIKIITTLEYLLSGKISINELK